jgi:hypothetical protein
MSLEDDCDCTALDRWKSWCHVLSFTLVIALTASVILGWTAAVSHSQNAALRERLQVTPADVLNRLQVTPADVLLRVEQLEHDLIVKPSEVLAEVKAMRAELQALKKQVDEKK